MIQCNIRSIKHSKLVQHSSGTIYSLFAFLLATLAVSEKLRRVCCQIHGRREGWSNQEALRDMDLVFEVGHLQVTRINQLFLRSTDVVFPVNGGGKKPPFLPSDHFLSYWFLNNSKFTKHEAPKA